MKRVMVNLDDSTGLLFEQKLRRVRRTASAQLALLVEDDLRAEGLLPAQSLAAAHESAVIAKLSHALSTGAVDEAALDRFLRTALRRRRATAAVAA